MRDAQAYKREEGIPWPVAVDDLQGTTHQVYGGLSDPIYLIDTGGRVAFYNMFAYAPAMHEALEELFAQGSRGMVRGGIDRVPHLLAPMVFGWPGLRRGLMQSVTDLMVATPGSPIIVWLAYQVRALFAPIALRATPLPAPFRAVQGLIVLALAGFAIWWGLARWRAMPVRKRTIQHREDPAAPRAIPKEAQQGDWPVQLTGDGTGKLFHRRYRADIANPTASAEQLMRQLQEDPNNFSPLQLANFEKTKGVEGNMAVGDEYYIHILGPWDGPVRVFEVQPTLLGLVTLEGHMEAGEIQFRFLPHPTLPNALRFEIVSWARSRDMMVDIAYDKLKLARGAQTNMWTHVCQRVVEESGGELIDKIDILTEELPFRGEVIPRE